MIDDTTNITKMIIALAEKMKRRDDMMSKIMELMQEPGGIELFKAEAAKQRTQK